MMLAALCFLAITGPLEKDILYSKAGGEELRMDLYRPADAGDKVLPCVVVIHGGAWIAGQRADMTAISEAFAQKGIAAANISYRLAKAPNFHKWPAMLDDAQTAVRFLRANAEKYHLDPNRIGAAGASAGAHLSLFLGSRDTRDPKPTDHPGVSSRVAAVLDLFGPTDMSQDYPKTITIDFLFQTVLGKPRAKAEAEIKDASPLLFMDAKSAPVFIVQGMDDPLVAPNQSKILEAKLKELGVPVESRYVEGMGHGGDANDPKIRTAYEAGIDWLVARLKG